MWDTVWVTGPVLDDSDKSPKKQVSFESRHLKTPSLSQLRRSVEPPGL